MAKSQNFKKRIQRAFAIRYPVTACTVTRMRCYMKQIYNESKTVTVFFAADDGYLPYLEVAIKSLSEHSSAEYLYDVQILSNGFSDESLFRLRALVKENITVCAVDMKEKIEPIKESLSLRLRDYYSDAIYYRLFIPSMFKDLKRAVYLDSDVVLLDDVAKLFFTPLYGKILGAVTDESVISVPVFSRYVKTYIGTRTANRYFNSGVLVMDLDGFRRHGIEERFIKLLLSYNFKTVAPDQDYLNFLCRGKVKYLPAGWNKHAIVGRDIPEEELHLVHYNMFNKPWRYDGVPYEKHFWHYADMTGFAKELRAEKLEYTDEMKARDYEAAGKLLESAADILENETPIYESVQSHALFSALGGLPVGVTG